MTDDSPLSNGDVAIPHGDLRVWNLLEQKDTAKYEREMDGQRRYHRGYQEIQVNKVNAEEF